MLEHVYNQYYNYFNILALFCGIFPFWVILKRLGFKPYLSIMAIFPLTNFLLLFYIAFSKWPNIDKE